MKLQCKVCLQLLGGFAVVLITSQGVQYWLTKRSSANLAGSSQAILEERELQNVRNIHAAVDFSVSEGVARGDMDVFRRLIGLQERLPGLVELSLYDREGKVADSSLKEARGRKLDPELKMRLFSQTEPVVQARSNTFEIYRPLIATAKCLECHEDYKAGSVGGVTYFRFSNDAATRLAARFHEITATSDRQGRAFNLAMLALGGLAATGLAALIVGPILKRLTRMIHDLGARSAEIYAAAAQVSTSSQTLSSSTYQQASLLEETSVSLEEVAAMTRRNAEDSRKVNDLAQHTRSCAEKGVAEMQAMEAAMLAISESGSDIAKINKTIDEIAFQTNILALNAAVEAARAGETGMGFAVVADEVRNLARRSAEAAKETSAKIQGAISKTRQGVAISAKVGQALQDIASRAREVDELAAGVATSSQEQNQGIGRIKTTAGQMEQATQRNAAAAAEGASAAEELNALAENMEQSVETLMELVGDDSRAKPAKGAGSCPPAPGTARQPASRVALGQENGHGRAERPDKARHHSATQCMPV